MLANVTLTGMIATILPARADSPAQSSLAESYIAGFFRATVETAVAPRSDENATKAVKVLLLREIPLDETAHFMLGRTLPTDNKEAGFRFQQDFRQLVAEAVTHSLRANPTVALDVKGSRPRPDGGMLVLSSLNLPSGVAVPVDWQVKQDPHDGRFQVTNIAVAGMDVAIMLRSIATTAIADGQTDVDGLIPWFRAALAGHSGDAAGKSATRPTVTSP